MPRGPKVFTMLRSAQSAAATSARVVSSTRRPSETSAADMTWACAPHIAAAAAGDRGQRRRAGRAARGVAAHACAQEMTATTSAILACGTDNAATYGGGMSAAAPPLGSKPKRGPAAWVGAFTGFYPATASDLSGLDPVARFLYAARSVILVISAQSAVIAGLLAATDRRFEVVPFVLVFVGYVVLHGISNLSNDYFGYKRGHDTEDSPRRRYTLHPVASGAFTMRFLATGLAVLAVVAAAIGVYFVVLRGWGAVGLTVVGARAAVRLRRRTARAEGTRPRRGRGVHRVGSADDRRRLLRDHRPLVGRCVPGLGPVRPRASCRSWSASTSTSARSTSRSRSTPCPSCSARAARGC